MERRDFEALVGRMEALERADPPAYRRRVLAWAALGYGFLTLVVLGLAGLCVLLVVLVKVLKAVAVKLLFIVIPALCVVLRSLWVRFEPPAGVRVTRADAPVLFDLIDDLRRQLVTPAIHEVVMTEELNAAVTQVPRLGMLGWHRNYLLLGLPLMKGLTVEQFKAVVAHELGHLSGGHARVGNWIYRLRRIWDSLDDAFSEQAQAGSGLIQRFFHWYSPRFSATSFPFARANEFEADAAAARLTSGTAAAQALTGINVIARFLDQKYWPSIHENAREQPQPAFAPYSSLAGSAVLEVPEAERERWQAQALARQTSYADTHPCLTDRLAALGAPAQFAPPAPGKGAETLLGDFGVRLDQRFDAEWRERVAASWREFHEDTQKARVRLAELRALAAAGPLDEDTLLERADVEQRVGDGADRALELRREAATRFPESPLARFLLGRQLLERDDPEGVPLLEGLVGTSAGFDAPVMELLRDYWWARGEKALADDWHDRHVVAARRMQEARQERDTLLTTDRFVPHGLDEAAVAALVAQLRAIANLRRVYLVRKITRHFEEQPLYVLGFGCAGLLQLRDEHRNAAAMHEIRTGVEFPGEAIIISIERPNREFAKLFRKVRGSRLL